MILRPFLGGEARVAAWRARPSVAAGRPAVVWLWGVVAVMCTGSGCWPLLWNSRRVGGLWLWL